MNEPQTIAPDYPIVLGQDRDRDYVGGILAEVWARIPQKDRAAIMSRGGKYGVKIEVLEIHEMPPVAGQSQCIGGQISLNRFYVDRAPRDVVAYILAHELAHKADDASRLPYDMLRLPDHPPAIRARLMEPKRNAERRVETIIRRWGLRKKPIRTQNPTIPIAVVSKN
jgi:hypothetical protein